MILWSLGSAIAGEVVVEVPFVPPAEVQLFTRTSVVDVKGAVKGGDCGAAVAAALSDAASHGTVVRMVQSRDDLAPVGSTACRQRLAGDDVSASSVELVAVVVEPGFPATIFPKVTAERTLQIAGLAGTLNGGGMASAEIVQVDGKPYLRSPTETYPETVDSGVRDPNGRAALVWDRYVTQWISRWAPVLTAVPELAGAVLEIVVTSEDPKTKKSRKTEIFRFVVPTAVGASYFRGGLTDDAFVVAILVERAEDPKKRAFQKFPFEIGEAGASLADTRADDRGPIDVPDEDLEGVEDE